MKEDYECNQHGVASRLHVWVHSLHYCPQHCTITSNKRFFTSVPLFSSSFLPLHRTAPLHSILREGSNNLFKLLHVSALLLILRTGKTQRYLLLAEETRTVSLSIQIFAHTYRKFEALPHLMTYYRRQHVNFNIRKHNMCI